MMASRIALHDELLKDAFRTEPVCRVLLVAISSCLPACLPASLSFFRSFMFFLFSNYLSFFPSFLLFFFGILIGADDELTASDSYSRDRRL